MSTLPPPILGSSRLPHETTVPERKVCALWPRIAAFLVDSSVLFLVGFLIGIPLFQTFSNLGAWGKLVGFCVALPYFAILNSSIGNGQTLGKRLMHIRVVDKNGGTLTFLKSVARYGIIAVPFFINDVDLPTARTPWAVSIAMSLTVSVTVLGLGWSSLYLVIFNRRTRQGIHDLAVGSYVAEADKSGPLRVEPTWGFHSLILCGLLFIEFVGTNVWGDSNLIQRRPFSQLVQDARLLQSMEGVQTVEIQEKDSDEWSDENSKKTLVISVYWSSRLEGGRNSQPIADEVAKRIIEHDPTIKERDSLKILLIRGYDIGIARAQFSYYYQHSPSEWKTRLFGTAPANESPSTKSQT